MTSRPVRDVLVIGSGPAGLGAAVELRRLGVARVTVVERQREAGGIPRHCAHSPYGMREFHRVLSGPAYAARLVAQARAAGVTVLTGHGVIGISAGPTVAIVSDAGTATWTPDAVILATGARETTRAAALVSGARLPGIMNTAALQDLIHGGGRVPFRRPVLCGSELVTNSAILTCLLAGIRPVALIESAARSVLRAPFSWFPRLVGLATHFGAEIEDIEGEGRVEAVTIRRADGTVRRIDCDGVVMTGRFVPESTLARAAGIVLDPCTGGPAVDTMGRTSLAGVHAAGNVLRGVETAGWSWQEGVRVARAVAGEPQEAAAAPIALAPGSGIARIVPQGIGPETGPDAFGSVQVRVSGRINGRIQAQQGDRTLWSAPLRSGPERRVLIPVDALRQAASGGAPVVISAVAR